MKEILKKVKELIVRNSDINVVGLKGAIYIAISNKIDKYNTKVICIKRASDFIYKNQKSFNIIIK